MGCGVGTTDKNLTGTFTNLSGCDVSEDSIEVAKNNNPTVEYKTYNGETLPFEDNTFDVVFTINVMHHVPPESWDRFLSECKRVLKKGGRFIVFEHNPLNPLTLKAVKACPFDKDAVLLKMDHMKELVSKSTLSVRSSSYIIFFPFKGKVFRLIEKLLFWLPLGAQYYVTATKK